jgi:hypothetical protein
VDFKTSNSIRNLFDTQSESLINFAYVIRQWFFTRTVPWDIEVVKVIFQVKEGR